MTTTIDSLTDDHLSLDLWLEHRHDFDIAAAIEDAAHRSPALFAELVHRADEYGIEPEDFSEFVGSAWVGVAAQHLDREWWRRLFEAAGYREDDELTDRPAQPLVLWRGAIPEFRANWSWTDHGDAAHMYASGWWVQQEIGIVWRAVVEPERLFARLSHGRHAEFVVDTDGLTIEPHELWCRCPDDLTPFLGSVEEARLALDVHELVTCTRYSTARGPYAPGGTGASSGR